MNIHTRKYFLYQQMIAFRIKPLFVCVQQTNGQFYPSTYRLPWWKERIQGLRSETSPDHARVSFYLYCSFDVNKDRMTP